MLADYTVYAENFSTEDITEEEIKDHFSWLTCNNKPDQIIEINMTYKFKGLFKVYEA